MPDNNFENLEVTPVVKKAKPRPTRKARPKTGGNLKTTNIASSPKISAKTASKKKDNSFGLYRKIAISFIVLTVMLIAVIFYFSFTKVSIIIVPKQVKVSGDLTIDIFDQSKNANLAEGVITGIVKQVEVEQTKTYKATGKKILGQEVTGKVTIINNYNKNQPLVATTRLLSPDNKLFRIKETINVPAGGQVEVEVYTDEASQAMAIGPSNFIIPGLWAGLQDKIFGQSKEAMQYKEKVKMVIEQSDIDAGVKDLKEDLISRAKEQIGASFKDYEQVLYEIDNNSITQKLGSKVGEEKDNFSISMKTMVSVIAFKDDKIFDLAKQKLISSLADDKELVEFNKKDVNYSLNSYNLETGIASISAVFSGRSVLKQNATVIDKNKLLGLTSDQLSQYLENIPEISTYQISFFPRFIKKVPELVDRIQVEIKK